MKLNIFDKFLPKRNNNSASVRFERSKITYPTGMTEEKMTIELGGLSTQDAISESQRLLGGVSSYNRLNTSEDLDS